MRVCKVLPPRRRDMINPRNDDYLPECILPAGHHCPHVVKTPEGVYIAWQDDMNCECCADDEDDRCYDFGEITEEQFQKYLKERD